MSTERPRIGVGILVFNDQGEVLLGKRCSNSHGDLTWGPPGGHLEYGESFAECALRELNEETGISIQTAVFAAVTNDVFVPDQKHYVSIFMKAICPANQYAQLCEPEKIAEWKWFALDNLPHPLFLPLSNLIESGFNLYNL